MLPTARHTLLLALALVAGCASQRSRLSAASSVPTPAKPGPPATAGPRPAPAPPAPTASAAVAPARTTNDADAADFAFTVAVGKIVTDDPPNDQNPLAYQSGSAKVALSYTLGGKSQSIELEEVGLMSHGELGRGEHFVIGPDGHVQGKRPEDLDDWLDPKPRWAAHRPPGTILSTAVIVQGERAWFSYYVYHLVRTAPHHYTIVRQTWMSTSPDPDDGATVKLKDLVL